MYIVYKHIFAGKSVSLNIFQSEIYKNKANHVTHIFKRITVLSAIFHHSKSSIVTVLQSTKLPFILHYTDFFHTKQTTTAVYFPFDGWSNGRFSNFSFHFSVETWSFRSWNNKNSEIRTKLPSEKSMYKTRANLYRCHLFQVPSIALRCFIERDQLIITTLHMRMVKKKK